MVKKLVVDNVYLFSTAAQRAKKISFTSGVNIITSDQEDGNKLGKSLILKSVYHTLGADCFFDDNLKKDSITFIVDFKIDDTSFVMLRIGNFFKLFDKDNELLMSTDSRSELAEKLYTLFDFSVYLPSRNENKLVIAPPVYAYMLNFIDQDHLKGSKFESFSKLGQFAGFKESLLYTHFGLFNKTYFNLKIQQDELGDKLRASEKELTTIGNMLEKIQKEIPEAVPEGIESLTKEMKRQETEYRQIYDDLKKTKTELADLRNTQVKILNTLSDVNKRKHHEERDIIHVMDKHTCPLCEQNLEDTLDVRLVKNINIEDLSQVSLELQRVVAKTKRDIEKNKKSIAIIWLAWKVTINY